MTVMLPRMSDRFHLETPLARRLRALSLLTAADFAALRAAALPVRAVAAGSSLIAEGGANSHAWVVIDGWAMRYKTLADGRRQVLNFLLPGDIHGLFAAVSPIADCTVEAVTNLRLTGFRGNDLMGLFARSGPLALAMTWLGSQDERILGEQIVRLGRRSAAERMAHLFLELYRRQMLAGIDDAPARRLPLTQRQLADCLGMSQVHANRSFASLVRIGAAVLENGHILLLNLKTLATEAGLAPTYHDPMSIPDRAHPRAGAEA